MVVGAQEGPAGGSGCQRPWNTSLAGRGALPGQWSGLKEGLRGVAFFTGPGTLAFGDVESCPGGGRCSKMACGG